jgi:hypothetical protein
MESHSLSKIRINQIVKSNSAQIERGQTKTYSILILLLVNIINLNLSEH